MIEFVHVSYTYANAKQPALVDLSLRIDEGNFVLVMGASGSGKSTFLRCINGLVPHFYGGQWAGQVRVAGRDTRRNDPRQLADVVGFVFQDPEAQMVVEVVEDELVFGMENLGISPQIMRRRVEEVLDQLEIAHLRRRRVTTLSGGERQRVAIAAVLAMQPKVLVLDEPTSQLDPHTAEEVLTALQKLNADLGLTIVLSEHRLERVVQYADHIISFERGPNGPPSVTIGPPRTILAHSSLAPPLVHLGRALGWAPLPLTIKEGRRQVVAQSLDDVRPADAPPATSALPAGWRQRQPNQHTPPAPVLQVDSLHVRRSNHAILHNVTLDLHSGEIVAIMGRNGAGKTTLLRTIMGLEPPSQGRIMYQGQNIAALPVEQRAKQIGYVPQDPRSLLFQETVVAELRWTLRQQRSAAATPEVEEDRVRRALEMFQLQHVATAHPRDLSGGEQQRVALASILVAEPAIVLLDEPTRGLDYEHKTLLQALLNRLKDAGRSIALVTHDVELAAACADRIVLLGNGEVVVTGPPRELLNSSLIFSSQIGKLFRHQPWLTVDEALAGLGQQSTVVEEQPSDQKAPQPTAKP